jgi:hypothetical protein
MIIPNHATLFYLNSTASALATQYGYPIPTCIKTDSLDSFALCNAREKKIWFKTRFLTSNKEEVVIALIKHEIAHLLHPGHGPEFEAACKVMGIKKHVWMQFPVRVKDHPYECPVCYKTYWMKEKLTKVRNCMSCKMKSLNRYENEDCYLVYKGDEICRDQ